MRRDFEATCLLVSPDIALCRLLVRDADPSNLIKACGWNGSFRCSNLAKNLQNCLLVLGFRQWLWFFGQLDLSFATREYVRQKEGVLSRLYV